MKKEIRLDSDDINELIDYLNERYIDNLSERCQMFVQALADIGIKTAKANVGQYSGLIVFSKEVSLTETGAQAIMVATDAHKVMRSWKYKGGLKTVEVSPLLMAEFGSGWSAKNPDGISGVGQGTFPDQKHAFDPRGWWWVDEQGERHHSMGEAPTYPMHSASVAMIFEIRELAKEYF